MLCAQKLSSLPSLPLSIFCLSAIEDVIVQSYASLSSPSLLHLRHLLLSYLSSLSSISPPPVLSLRGKLAKTLIIFFRMEYPESWPTFFSDLLEALSLNPLSLPSSLPVHSLSHQSRFAIDFFFRVMVSIDDLVVEKTVTGTDTLSLSSFPFPAIFFCQTISDFLILFTLSSLSLFSPYQVLSTRDTTTNSSKTR